jgi:hypothetical protein
VGVEGASSSFDAGYLVDIFEISFNVFSRVFAEVKFNCSFERVVYSLSLFNVCVGGELEYASKATRA